MKGTVTFPRADIYIYDVKIKMQSIDDSSAQNSAIHPGEMRCCSFYVDFDKRFVKVKNAGADLINLTDNIQWGDTDNSHSRFFS